MTHRSSARALGGGTDERILIEAAQKDPGRFAELYECHFELVYAFALKRLGNRAEAEDVTSEVFQRALASLPRFQWRGAPFGAWLLKIAANAIANRWVRAARERGVPAREESLEVDWEETQRRAWLFRLVDALAPDQRRVIRMRFGEERSIREIARELGRTEGAVKQLQFRALKNLRAQMGEIDG
jgi:RNA polymerase sigma-70 factor, ECF subfamily